MESTKKNLIIVHGAGPRHYRSLKDGTGDWQSRLSVQLGREYKVLAPQMPSPNNPSYDEWKLLLEKNLAKVKGEVQFVGHSLGGSFLIKYLSENSVQNVTGLYLVSAPFNTVKGFEAPADYSGVTEIRNIYLYHCVDDVEVPYAHAIILQERLGAKLRTFSDRGHYFKREEFPEIVSDLKRNDVADRPPLRASI